MANKMRYEMVYKMKHQIRCDLTVGREGLSPLSDKEINNYINKHRDGIVKAVNDMIADECDASCEDDGFREYLYEYVNEHLKDIC